MSIRRLAAIAAVALTTGAATAAGAQAMPLGDLAAASAAATHEATQVRWVCGPYRCWWRPNYYYAPPAYYGYYAPRRYYRWHGPRYRYGWYRHHRYWR